VAHDLNNILVVLMGCADGLRRSLQSGLPPDAEDVEELEAGAHRARDLTEQLLAYARRRVVAPVRLDLNEQVRQAERMLHRLIGENVFLTLRLRPGALPTTCDPGQLSQVLVNLVLNARDAMPDGGRLTIATESAEDGDRPVQGWQGGPVPRGPCVRLTVEDSGSGIPPELGRTVFEPFVTTKPAGKGTGLGLATVYGIVQQAGGAIRYRSEPGSGTVFEILLPRATGEPFPSVAGPSALAPLSRPGGQVLLVEDDPHVRAMVERALRQGGYEVIAAESGESALEMLRRTGVEPRILVTDVVLRGLNGRQVAEAVQRVRPGIPVLFMSGYAHDIVVRHGSVEPGLHLIEKPFTGEALLERVQGLIAPG
jgi:CheY-like chemotaxis protein